LREERDGFVSISTPYSGGYNIQPTSPAFIQTGRETGQFQYFPPTNNIEITLLNSSLPLPRDNLFGRRPVDPVWNTSALTIPAVAAGSGSNKESLRHHQPPASIRDSAVLMRLCDFHGRSSSWSELPFAGHETNVAIIVFADGHCQYQSHSAPSSAKEDKYQCHHHWPWCAWLGCSSGISHRL
jgi:hypothetical protein